MQENQLRIIGGRWRSRTISFVDAPALRPTPNRIRETLFNWVQAIVPGANCLDLFAGSGALGFEAASRGAATVTMVENNPHTVQQLEINQSVLEADAVRLVQASAIDFLASSTDRFNLVFLDPPFHQGLLQQTCEQLMKGGHLLPDALVYLEYEKSEDVTLPDGLEWLRQKTSGDVSYGLACRCHPG